MHCLNYRHITDLSLTELREAVGSMGEPDYRLHQLKRWVYQKRVGSFEAMSNVPKRFRAVLAERFDIAKLKIASRLSSSDGDAVKFAFTVEQDNGTAFESVLLYDGKRRTACLSSQLGCGLGCSFCETGRMGFLRNLSRAEILGQLIALNDYLADHEDKLVTNVVFMGMGEALGNYSRFRSSLDIIMDEDCFNLGGRRITVSTAGVVPSIDRFAEERLNVGLAVSLNAYNDRMRERIMPINRQYPIAELIAAARRYAAKTGTTVTFEYVVVRGENDGEEAVGSLIRLLKGLPCKLNLIPMNPAGEGASKAPSDEALRAMADKLFERGLTVTVRKSRGRDIWGACGQLAGKLGENLSKSKSGACPKTISWK
ncbi:MAG: 23S rRNA (adenine(2503)-C(2))-methyltransferase RlmN [Chitinivibrionales bacterium]|nr:23S rRNA (adenine(2503)-C(2))-methyltransferase RlmN [Chitinivibrionales bacterium]MBD3356124.1 23S rRNA (adenine(2503)-C(2))-methyltransferase RlmN [Chitinivibrionales bacterium]